MKEALALKSLTRSLFKTYVDVGIKAYNQHYHHLWPQGDSTPYLESSFTESVLFEEEKEPNTELYIIYSGTNPVGILKLTKDKSVEGFYDSEALLLDKVYVLNEYSGKGIGKEVLLFLFHRAKQLKKKVVWLDTMKKGPALNFYLKNGFTIHSETRLHFQEAIEAEKPMYILVRSV